MTERWSDLVWGLVLYHYFSRVGVFQTGGIVSSGSILLLPVMWNGLLKHICTVDDHMGCFVNIQYQDHAI